MRPAGPWFRTDPHLSVWLRGRASRSAFQLATANLALLLRVTTAPEVMARATLANRLLLQQATSITLQLMQTGAFA